MRARAAVARACQHFSQCQSAQGDSFWIEPGTAEQLQMLAHDMAADSRGHNQCVARLPPDSGECDHGIVHRERQMFFQCERDHLLKPTVIREWQRQQSFGDVFSG